MNQKKTVVLGASENPARYGRIAVERLRGKGHPVIAVGKREGMIGDVPLLTGMPEVPDTDTVTLYLNPANQQSYYEYILKLSPRRIIFNPGTENPELEALAAEQGIETVQACTLVMLSVGNY